MAYSNSKIRRLLGRSKLGSLILEMQRESRANRVQPSAGMRVSRQITGTVLAANPGTKGTPSEGTAAYWA